MTNGQSCMYRIRQASSSWRERANLRIASATDGLASAAIRVLRARSRDDSAQHGDARVKAPYHLALMRFWVLLGFSLRVIYRAPNQRDDGVDDVIRRARGCQVGLDEGLQ